MNVTDNQPWIEELRTTLTSCGGLGEHSPAQLATISGPKSGKLEGRPACRTVIIRKVEETALHFGTCAGALKLDDTANGSSQYSELCWYFAAVRTQFRISALTEVESDAQLRKEVWDAYSDIEKKRLYCSRLDLDESEQFDPERLAAVPDFLVAVKLVPSMVHILHLEGKSKERTFEVEQSESQEVFHVQPRGP